MLPFSSLSSNERALLMLMAYFYSDKLTEGKLRNLSAMIMSPALFEQVFVSLRKKKVLREELKYYYNGPKVYQIGKEMVIPAVISLFKAENKRLLTSIRSAYNAEHRYGKPASLVRLTAYFAAPTEPEAIESAYGQTVDDFCRSCSALLCDKEYASFFQSVSDDVFSGILNLSLCEALIQDKEIDWAYLKGLVSDSRKNTLLQKRTLESVFAFYYYLGTGEFCIDLHKSIVNPFSLQVAAIDALYKGDNALAYKLYTKAMTVNNKVAPQKGIFINPISNYYFALASILTNTETSLKKVETMIKRNGESFYSPTYFLVSPLKAYFCDKSDPEIPKQAYEKLFENADMRMVLWLTWRLYRRLGILSDSVSRPLEKPNWAYLKHEVEVAEDKSYAGELQKKFGGASVLGRLEIKSVWQLRLETLIAESREDGDKGKSDDRESMLAYLIRYGIIVPILKRRLKNGAWSVGKELSVRELLNLNDPCLDSVDQHIKESVSPWEYNIYVDKYIYLFVDCDHVYTGTTYDLHPVTVHYEKPYLIIDKRKDGSFGVSTNVEELEKGEKGSFFYRKNTETDYSVFIPSAFEYKTYKNILAQKVYPAEAEPLLIQLITEIGGKTEIHSNMVAELGTLERADVQPCIVLRVVSAADSSFQLTASVRASDSLAFVPGKGNITAIAERDGKKFQLVRNLKQERENMKEISRGLSELDFFEEEEWMPESIAESLTLPIRTMLPFIQWCKEHEDVCVMEWAEGCRITCHPSVSSSAAHIAINPKNNWFEVEGDIEISDGQVLSLQKLLDLMHQNARQKYIRIGDNEFITISSQLSRILKRLDTVTNESRSHLQMAPTAVSLLGDLLDDETLDIQCNEAVDALRRRIEESSRQVPVVPKTLQAQLRDYQEEGFEWMSKLTAWGAGVCLADDMGLGKTVQTTALLLEQQEKGASLIVAPASVVPNWCNELRRFAPTLNVTVLNQSEDRSKDIKEAKAGDIIIITYALLNIQQEDLTAREWNVVCLDEAHTIKNANTKMSKAAMRLQAQRRVILTGTPIQNHLAELWNLFQFINPGLLGSAEQFKKKFILPIEGDNDKNRQSQLRKLISPFLLRRTKSEVIDELPEKNEIKLPVELSSDEMAMYEVRRRETEERVRANVGDKMSTLAEITRLRQMACSCSLVDRKWKLPSSKVLAFIDLAESLDESGNRALVFSQFTSFFEEVKQAMDKAKLSYLYLDGSTPMAMREKLVKDFQTGKCPFFLISLKAGGLGLNLTGANYVIHLDPWWNPAIEQQATDRAYRIGQKQNVTVYHLISQHTIEEKILRLHKTKRNLSDSLLEGSDIAHAMTQEELLELLQDNR